MTDTPYDDYADVEAAGVAAVADEGREYFGRLDDMELISTVPPNGPESLPMMHQMEMSRRLKDAVVSLTADLVSFQQSSHSDVVSLTTELVRFRKSSDRLSKRLVVLTWVLVVLTVILVAVTIIQALHS